MSSYPGPGPDSEHPGDPGGGASPAPEPSPSGYAEGQAPPPPGASPPPPGAPLPEAPPFGAPTQQPPYGPAPGQFGGPAQQGPYAQQAPYGPAPGQWGAPPYYAAGPPGLPVDPAKARNTAMLAHLSAFIGLLGIPSPVGPLIVWLTQREQDPYIDDQGREALNFNISVAIYFVVMFIASFVTFGLLLILTIPAFIALGIAWVVLVIIAAVKANNGEPFRYPMTIRLIS